MTDSTKRAFLPVDSARVKRVSGRVRARGRPGKPGPVPASRTVLAPAKSFQGMTESRMCLMAASRGVVMRVRFITSLISVTSWRCREAAAITRSRLGRSAGRTESSS